MSITENIENISGTIDAILTTEATAKIFLRSDGRTEKARKAAEYIASGKWQENPAHIVSYEALYGKFLMKLPDGKRTGEQAVKALEWFYERLYVKWKLEG